MAPLQRIPVNHRSQARSVQEDLLIQEPHPIPPNERGAFLHIGLISPTVHLKYPCHSHVKSCTSYIR